jgi:hypothetical protein
MRRIRARGDAHQILKTLEKGPQKNIISSFDEADCSR